MKSRFPVGLISLLNAKFDEVFASGGIYSFLSHPQMIDYGPDSFYERHLAHIGGRQDIWYVPMGPLYAYHALAGRTSVQALIATGAGARFPVFNQFDPEVYNGSITLKFGQTPPFECRRQRTLRTAGPVSSRWDGQYFRRTAQIYW